MLETRVRAFSPGGGISASLSAGNTSGTLALVSSGTMYLAGGNNITLSQNNNSITISGANAEGGSNTLGMSNIGNTSGTTGVVSESAIRFLLAGGNNITLSQSLNGASGTITISAFGQSVESQSFGMSNIGNTSGTSGIASGGQLQFLLAGGNNVTLSQSLNGASGTISVSGINPGAQAMSFWQNMGVAGSTDNAASIRVSTGVGSWSHGELKIFPLDIGNNIFAGNMTVSTILFNVTAFSSLTAYSNYTLTFRFGLYTIANSSVLSLLNSGSVSFGSSFGTASGASGNHASLFAGRRHLTMNSSAFSAAINMTQGLYYAAILFNSSQNSIPFGFMGAALGETGVRSGTFGAASSTQTLGAIPFMGVHTASTNAFPASVAASDLQKTAYNAIFVPNIMFNNNQSLF